MEPIEMAVPQLPSDLLFLIFGELTTKERTPLGTSCRRFREIDFDVGKRLFDTIDIELLRVSKTMCVSGFAAGREYVIQGSGPGPVDPTYHNRLYRKAKVDTLKRLYRKAKVDTLKIWVNRDSSSTDLASLQFISSFFDRTQFNRLAISAKCDQSAIEFLISMTKHRSLADSQVSLNLCIPRESPGASISQAKAMLTQLSSINQLKLDGGITFKNKKRVFTERFIDDATLHHLVANINHSELGKADCSVQGILGAFQVFCDSTTYKYAVVDIPNICFGNIFEMPNLAYRKCILPNEQWAVYDPASRAVLAGKDPNDVVGVYTRVEMGKLDEKFFLTNVPCLPDDLMFMIFGELSTEERFPLGRTCRRFREIDFQLGRRTFNKIHIDLDRLFKGVRISVPNSEYIIEIDCKNSDPNHYNRFFRKSITDILSIWINRDTNLEDANCLRSCFEKIRFKRLNITLHYYQTCNDFVISTISSHNIAYDQVCLAMWNAEDLTVEDIARTRELVMRFPKINKFRMVWQFVKTNNQRNVDYERLVDDQILLHIVKNTQHAELCKSECSALGMLDAFEIISRSQENYKFIEFQAPRSSIEELFALSNLRYQRHQGHEHYHCLSDPRGKTILRASISGTGVNVVVVIGKVHQKSYNKEDVSWT